MRPVATILVPTHNHGPTLPLAVSSALRQTEAAIEVIIIGDGVDGATREAAGDLSNADSRVRFIERPKAPRHGETYRHEVLMGEARGRLIFYLSDDDLWMPEHVATLRDLIDERDVDFVSGLTAGRLEDGTWVKLDVDLGMPGHRQLMVAGHNRVGLSSAAHTLAAYRRLPYGWRAASTGIPTDLYMWQQWLSEDWPRYASASRVTVLNFPSGQRGQVGLEARVQELKQFEPALSDPSARLAFLERLIADEAPRAAWLEVHYRAVEGWLDEHVQALDWHREKLAEATTERQHLLARIAQLEADLASATSGSDDGHDDRSPR